MNQMWFPASCLAWANMLRAGLYQRYCAWTPARSKCAERPALSAHRMVVHFSPPSSLKREGLMAKSVCCAL